MSSSDIIPEMCMTDVMAQDILLAIDKYFKSCDHSFDLTVEDFMNVMSSVFVNIILNAGVEYCNKSKEKNIKIILKDWNKIFLKQIDFGLKMGIEQFTKNDNVFPLKRTLN